jgi:hypothetical protein
VNSTLNTVNLVERIADACGGWVGYKKTTCPCCGGKMSVAAGEKQPVIVWCWNTPPCEFNDIRAKLEALGAWSRSALPSAPRRQSSSQQSNISRLDWCDIVDGAVVVEHPRLDRYLRSRAIEGKYAPYLRLLKTAAAARLGLAGRPHMVAVIVDAGGQPCGCQVTELAIDSPGRMKHPAAKRTYGRVRGCTVPLGDHLQAETTPLVIGEGVETVCSYLEINDGLPGIATLGAQNLPNVSIGTYQRVIILVDRDENGVGQKCAEQLRARLRRQGIRVKLASPPLGMKDWNDYACKVRK